MKISASLGLRFLNTLPNLWTGSLHAAAFFLGCLCEVVPDGGKPFFDYGELLTKKSIERGKKRQLAIEDIEKEANKARVDIAQSNKRVADDDANTTKTIKPAEIAAEKSRQEVNVINHEVKTEIKTIRRQADADQKVIDQKGLGQIEVIEAGKKQGIEKVQEKTKFELKEQVKVHKTTMFSLTKEHFQKMIELNKGLGSAANEATSAAKEHSTQMRLATKNILQLNIAIAEVIKMQGQLTKAIKEYDTTVIQGDIAEDHAMRVKDAVIQAIKVEGALETLIETSDIEHKSELRCNYKKDLASKNRELDNVLAECSSETLEKLRSLIGIELKEQQKSINQLTSPIEKERAQRHLEKLTGLLDQTNHVSLREQDQKKGPGID